MDVVLKMLRWSVMATVMVAADSAASGGEASTTRQPGCVLFLAPVATVSHKNFFMGVAEALADRGHQVTMVSPYEPSRPRTNIREVVLRGVSVDSHMPNMFQGKTGPVAKYITGAAVMCSDALATEGAQGLQKEEYDVVLISSTFTHCFLPMVHRMKVPYIWITPAVPYGMTDDWIANPVFPSFKAFPLVEAHHPLTFAQRALSTVGDTLFTLIVNYYVVPSIESLCRSRGLCPKDAPSLNELQYNASLQLINSVSALDSPPRPSTPNVVSVGGIHCRPPRNLPQDLESWVQAAGEDGFIFFSLGSTVKPSDMPEEYRQILVKVFGSLKQRVLWKWDQDSMPDLPPNVRLGKWLPQQDILGHPLLRLFITHGGLLSTLEATFHGVPVLGLPVAIDQQSNMVHVVQDGWGQLIYWDQMSEETLRRGIATVMTDESMKAEARRRSRVMKDQLQDPGDVASFWVQYVIRHDGAPHLRSPLTTMAWYQVYNVDVWLTVAAVVLAVCFLLLQLLLCLCRRCCSSSRSRDKKKRE